MIARLLLCALLLTAVPAHAQISGILVVQKRTGAGNTTTTQTYLAGNFIRTETDIPGTPVSLFDGQKQVAYELIPSARTYVQLDRSEMAATVERMLSEISVQLGTLPEAVRLQIEQQLKAELERYRAPPAVSEPPLREFVEIDTTKVGDRSCTRYVQDRTGLSVLCVVPAADFGVAAEDFEVLRLQQRFVSSLQPSSGPAGELPLSPVLFISGLVASKPFSGVVLRWEGSNWQAETVRISRGSWPTEFFQLPPDFKKTTMPIVARPGGARTPVMVIPPK